MNPAILCDSAAIVDSNIEVRETRDPKMFAPSTRCLNPITPTLAHLAVEHLAIEHRVLHAPPILPRWHQPFFHVFPM